MLSTCPTRSLLSILTLNLGIYRGSLGSWTALRRSGPSTTWRYWLEKLSGCR